MKLINRDITIDLTKSHAGPRRVFWVGDYYWNQMNRPVSKQRSLPSRTHGQWTFIHHPPPNGDDRFILEIPFVSWVANKFPPLLENKHAEVRKNLPR